MRIVNAIIISNMDCYWLSRQNLNVYKCVIGGAVFKDTKADGVFMCV